MEQAAPHTAPWPAGSSEMAERIRNHDWASTPLGAVETWPQSLRTAVEICLGSGFASYVWWGRDLVQIYNDAALAIVRAKHPAALGLPAREAWSDVWAEIGPLVERVVGSGATVVGEDLPMVPDRGGDHETAYFTFSYSALRNETGAIDGLFIVAIETTEQFRADTALRRSEERLRRVLETDAVGVLFFDHEGKLIDANDVFLRMTGWSREDVASGSLDWRRMTPPEWVAASGAEMKALAKTGRIGPYEKEYLHKDGSRSWMLFAGRELGDGTIVEFAIDVGPRKRAEEALRESEELFRLIVENARNYAILMTDPQDRITGWFAGAASVFGWSAEEIIGQPGSVLYTPEDREAGEPEREIGTARARGFAPDVRWHLRKDGRRVFIEGGVTALHRHDGSLQGFLKIGQDTTERQIYEQALKASERHAKLLLAELQHRVRNTLAVIRSIARRTAMTSETAEDYAMHLEGRIDAFARVQAAVTRDPRAGLDLEMLVADELRAVVAREGEQVKSISGPGIRLHSKAAETFALAAHELATNAVKYGALSVPEGRIEVTWNVDRSGAEPRLVFDWIETGGPLSNDRPRRRGFGTELIERTLSYELGGEAQLNFMPGGLRCTIVLPLDNQTFVLEQARGSEPH